MTEYRKLFEKSINDPEKFWSEAAADIHWDEPWRRVLDDAHPPFYRWFDGAKMNTCYNAVDRHAEGGRADQPAIIYDSPVTSTKAVITYGQLLDRVSRTAGMLARLGVGRGDRVVIYMPMIPEAAIAMLACARIGAIHSVVFGGFAARELAIRIDDAKPKVILSASCGIEPKGPIPYKPLLDEAIERSSHKPDHCIIFQRPQVTAQLMEGRDFDWMDLESRSKPASCVSLEATDPLYILYTSGTTGMPKGVVRDNGGHAVALHWTMKHIYGIRPGDRFWAASDVGWVVGHSYIVYGPLLVGATTVLYEGKPVGTPDPGAFWRVIAEHRVKVLFTAPTALRAIKREDSQGKHCERYDLSRFDALFLAGERTDPDTYQWASNLLGKPVIDHWWQTETGWAITGNFRGLDMLPLKAGTAGVPMPGYQVTILDPESGKPVTRGENGVIAVQLPLPPGTFPTLWNDEARFEESYMAPFPGYYFTGDGGFMDEDGYLSVMGRVDDVINVAGHRLSTGAMEEILARHPDVAECAVLGAADNLKGQVPIGFVVLKAGTDKDTESIGQELVAAVRSDVGPIACFKTVIFVNRLPKTRSGKILRGTMRKIADGQDFRVPSTIDDPAALDEISKALQQSGWR